MNIGRALNRIVGLLIYLALVWTVREMIHEAYDPVRQAGSMPFVP